MTLTEQILQNINELPEGRIFGYDELLLSKSDYTSAAKVIERLRKSGVIKRFAKGMFYKPEQTIFGELKPDREEQLRSYLFENNKRIAYETGVSLYNRMGLTTQMSFRIRIASRDKRIRINSESLKASGVKSYAEVTEDNYKTLGLLDAFKDAKRIPDCSVSQAVRRLSAI